MKGGRSALIECRVRSASYIHRSPDEKYYGKKGEVSITDKVRCGIGEDVVSSHVTFDFRDLRCTVCNSVCKSNSRLCNVQCSAECRTMQCNEIGRAHV